MADTSPPIETVAIVDKTNPVSSPADNAALDKIINDVYNDMAKIGLGPLSTLNDSTAAGTDDHLPRVDIFDSSKYPITDSATDTSQPGHLDLPFRLEAPAVKFDGDGYTVAVAPTADPFKQEGGIKVSGTFSNP